MLYRIDSELSLLHITHKDISLGSKRIGAVLLPHRRRLLRRRIIEQRIVELVISHDHHILFAVRVETRNHRMSLCHQIQDELERSNEECKTLQRQIHAAQEQLSGASSKTIDEEVLNRQIKEQERVIEGLNRDIDDANEEIAKLKRENQSLRDRLLHSD